ncbi:MAG: serine--tRNA ligase, partial [Desulfurococcaceae archaeon]
MSWSILVLLREKPDLLKEYVKKRFMDLSIVDKAYELDLLWRKLLTTVQEVRHKHNIISREVSRLPEHEKEKKIDEARRLLDELNRLESELKIV